MAVSGLLLLCAFQNCNAPFSSADLSKKGSIAGDLFAGALNGSRIASLSAAGTRMASIGFAEAFIIGNARAHGYRCPLWGGTEISQCANVPAISDHTIKSFLSALSQKGVRVHKETLPMALLMDPSATDHLLRVLELYQAFGMKLVLELSFPILGNPNNMPCFPKDDKRFEIFVYEKLANPLAAVFLAISKDSRLNQNWFQNNVIVTPWGEFDNVPALNTDGTCETDKDGNLVNYVTGSPKKAAIMTAVFNYVFYVNQLKNEITAPSIANVYGGELKNAVQGKYDKLRYYLKDYYSASAELNSPGGRPNIHLYFGAIDPRLSAEQLVADYESGIQTAVADLPERFRGKLIIGETGFADALPVQCEPSMGGIPVAKREEAYLRYVQSEVVHREVEIMTLWRLFNLDDSPHPGYSLGLCEATFGVVHAGEWPKGFVSYEQSFKGAGLKVFEGMYRKWSGN